MTDGSSPRSHGDHFRTQARSDSSAPLRLRHLTLSHCRDGAQLGMDGCWLARRVVQAEVDLETANPHPPWRWLQAVVSCQAATRVQAHGLGTCIDCRRSIRACWLTLR